jgi:serine/threonine-protein kinase
VGAASAVDLADLLLAAVARGRTSAILLEPAGPQHAVSIERSTGASRVTTLPTELGDAVVARLSFVANLDLTAGEQLARMRLRAGAADCQVLVSVRAAADGLSAELRRISPPPAGAGGPALHVSPADATRIGPYRLTGELGRGGTGVVYRAEHEVLGKAVAIKILYVEVAADPVASSRFVREARAASRARHPGIVEVIDFGALPDGRAYLVMELIQGKTLEQLLGRGALDPLRAVLLARQIALALEAAHQGGVVHRDLKPANVFVLDEGDGERDPAIKLADFGAAKLDPTLAPSPAVTQGNLVFGTPYYMSPEHASGRPTDRRTDLYSLGCVLYELLAGDVPFTGETAFDIMTKQVNDPPPALVSPFGPLPGALERVVARALAKPLGERYQTARELASDLESVVGVLRRAGWRRWLPL